jgi:hypothetical protein
VLSSGKKSSNDGDASDRSLRIESISLVRDVRSSAGSISVLLVPVSMCAEFVGSFDRPVGLAAMCVVDIAARLGEL